MDTTIAMAFKYLSTMETNNPPLVNGFAVCSAGGLVRGQLGIEIIEFAIVKQAKGHGTNPILIQHHSDYYCNPIAVDTSLSELTNIGQEWLKKGGINSASH